MDNREDEEERVSLERMMEEKSWSLTNQSIDAGASILALTGNHNRAKKDKLARDGEKIGTH